MTVLMLPVLIGFASLALDSGYAFEYRQQLQTAADAAALAAEIQLQQSPSSTTFQLENTARFDTAGNGFTHGTAGVTVTVNHPPSANSVLYSGDTNAVEVVVSQPRSTFFGNIIGFPSFTLTARAVGSMGSGDGTIIILDPTANNAFVVSGGSGLTIGGDVHVNSTSTAGIAVTGGSTVTLGGAGTFYDSASSCSQCSGITPAPTYSAAQIIDPFANLGIPTTDGGSYTANFSSGPHNILHGTYSSGITLTGTAVGNFEAGVYIVGGTGLTIKTGAQASGTGVTFYLSGTNAKLDIENNGTVVNFSAPTSGANEGMLIFQDRTDTQDGNIKSGAVANLSGAIYLKNAHLDYSGGANTGLTAAYTVIVVKTLTMSGGSSYANNDFSSLSTGSPVKSPTLGE